MTCSMFIEIYRKIGQTFIIIGITMVITLVTAMSTSAITTNGEIGGGENNEIYLIGSIRTSS